MLALADLQFGFHTFDIRFFATFLSVLFNSSSSSEELEQDVYGDGGSQHQLHRLAAAEE
jgi:hypothetical protein